MKKIICIFLSLIIIISASFLGGCAEDDSPAPCLVIISGYHANAPVPNFTSSELTDAVFNCCYNYGNISIIVDDGDPYLAGQWEINPSSHSVSENTRNRTATAQRNVILSALKTSKAKTPESDLLASLALAARIFSGVDNGTEKNLLITSSCLSTSGYVDFAHDNLLCADPEAVVEYLRQTDTLPELNGVTIRIAGLGDTESPQDDLTPSNIKQLKAIWMAILTEAGADVEFLDSVLPSGIADNTLPEVSSVPVIRGIEDDIDFSDIIILGEEQLAFKPDSTELLDEMTATNILKPYAETLKLQTETTVVLCGRTATVPESPDNCVGFSLRRAETVKDILVSLGVSPAQIITVGLGFESRYHIPDFENGKLTESAAANRCVMIIDAASDEGRFILANYM